MNNFGCNVFSGKISCEAKSYFSDDSPFEISPIAVIQANAVSAGSVSVWGIVEGYEGSELEAYATDGTWKSIGSIGPNNEFFNPGVPTSYLVDDEHIRLRVAGVENSEVTYPVIPVITNLAASLNSNGSISLTGTTTLKTGGVQVFSEGIWKGVGVVENGSFSNFAVPHSYLLNESTLRVQVKSDEASSEYVDASLDFPHSRSVLCSATLSSQNEQSQMGWRHQKADYQPTGYYAPAGVDVEVWVAGNIENVTLFVGIQGMADKDDITIQSPNMRAYRLVRGKNIIRDTIGGVIHIRNLVGDKKSVTRIIFNDNASPIPYYIDGQTTTEQWEKMVSLSLLAEVELVNIHRSVVAAFRTTLLLFPGVSPKTIVDSHEKVLSLEADISGLDSSSMQNSRTTLWLYAVEGSASASPHATTGYISLPCNGEINEHSQALVGGRAENQWVTLHEYGHHHQNALNGFSPITETSPNEYALAVYRVYPDEYTDVFPTRWTATQEWLALPRNEKEFATCPDGQAFYEQLREGFGEDFLRGWDQYIRANLILAPGITSFVLSASIVSGCNLCDFFADWALLSDSDVTTWNAVAELNLPPPDINLTALVPYS
jgi:hypothetical protein